MIDMSDHVGVFELLKLYIVMLAVGERFSYRVEVRSTRRPNVARRKFKIKVKFNSGFKSPSKIGSDFCTARIAQASMQKM